MQPDIANVETPDWVAGGSALLLFIALFLPWVHRSVGGLGAGNAGPSFAWIGILSVLATWGVLVVTIMDVELPFDTWIVYVGAGALAILLSVLMILIRPIGVGGLDMAGIGISKLPWYGAFIGLIASVGILVGGFLKRSAEGY